MRRKDREITDIDAIIRIIDRCKVCRLGLSDNAVPYVVPLNYGYAFTNGELTLFFHGAPLGRKVTMIRANPEACFEIDRPVGVVKAGTVCACGYAFKSVIGFGEIRILEDPGEKRRALRRIIRHQIGASAPAQLPAAVPHNLLVFQMNVREFTGKQRLYASRR
ncbi:MAG: pyridoxamine 5'-phosphate oxidase family protein [Spirochaetaceae bacterium]|jgi:nitroimidazol reductase NimA-like FMN-containing flavoprotein (pyridoxamine 5'-phosphate oxidase superfamily)|nr:pyridoxamine 5'-phosphate oxidase family protein [Spirochaetaceae bacterium]